MIEPEEEYFPLQENRGIYSFLCVELDPDKTYDEMRDRLMEQFEIDRQREAEGDFVFGTCLISEDDD